MGHDGIVDWASRAEAGFSSLGTIGEYGEQIVQSAAKDTDTLKGYLSAFKEAGADEVICFPASGDPAQAELLAEAIGL